jgi:hypothetical protein
MILKPTHTLMAVDPIGNSGGSTASPLNPGEIAEENRTAPPPRYEDPEPFYDDDYFDPDPGAADTSGSGAATAGSGGTTDPAEGDDTSKSIDDYPGQREVWSVDGVLYLVWFIPNTEPPIPILYEVTADVEMTTLPVADKTFTQADVDAMGGLVQGSARLLDDADPEDHPYESFIDKWEDELKIKPWLEDPEIMAIMFGNYLEGEAGMSLAELKGTTWWRTHTPQQRQWAALYHGDPMAAEQMIEDNRMRVRNLLIESGMDGPHDGLINLIADNATMGEWSAEYTNSQIKAVTDPYSGIEVDPELAGWISAEGITPDTSKTYTSQVRDLVSRWLGPSFAAGWSDENIASWAGEFRNNPDAEEELIEILRGQRMALFPGYTNPNLTYEDIAAPWRSFMMQHWGHVADEMDPLFHQIVNMNDSGKAATILRKEGLSRGNTLTIQNATKAFADAMGGAVVRSDPAVR